MNRLNYKELWEQLKVVASCGSRKRWGKNELLETMTSLEVYQSTKEDDKIRKTTKEVSK